MKKLLAVLAMCGMTMGMTAQDIDEVPMQKHSVATNSFWSNWFVQAGADWNAYYSNEEHGSRLSHSPFKGFRATPGFSVAIGKWFTPGMGLRTKFQGVWGRTVTDADKHSNHVWTLSENALFNLSNMLYGYNPERVWNFVPFLGAGVNRNCSADRYAINLSAGLLNTFRLSRKVALNLEVGWNNADAGFDGIASGLDKNAGRVWEGKDNRLYAEIGFTFNLGKASWNKSPDIDAINTLSQSQIDALNAQLEDANAENARLNSMLSEKSDAPAEVKSYGCVPVSVFFNINKTKIASRKDLVNVRAFAEYAKKSNARIIVTGYADDATGSAEHNQKLSEKRAATVADELVKMGVSRDRITTEGKGGVKDLSPNSYNRRVVVELAE